MLALFFRVRLSSFHYPSLPTQNIRTHRHTHTLRRVPSLLSSRFLEVCPHGALFSSAQFEPRLYGVQGLTPVHSGFQQRVLIGTPACRGRAPPSLFSTCTFQTASASAEEKGEKRVSVSVIRSANGCLTHYSGCRSFPVEPFSQISCHSFVKTVTTLTHVREAIIYTS
mgnify:CR=1 FL=1